MIKKLPNDEPPGEPVAGPARRSAGRQKLLVWLPAVLLVLGAYVWLVSVGTWTRWPTGSTYYDQLATAFRAGHLWLEARPDPALLALPNPYDPDMRKDVPFLSDASLYEGRYYLYFGPVPALILLAIKVFLSAAIGDQFLVFGFTCGTFLVLSLFAITIWRRFFPDVSAWMVGCSILLMGLTSPFGWILVSRASVHDAAIAGGQFFFLSGLYMAFSAFRADSIAKSRGILAGVFWAAALGSRITQIIPIACMMILVAGASMMRNRLVGTLRQSLHGVLAFALPLALGLAALGWYNWARFGSIFETGIKYQLALLYIQAHPEEIFSSRYIVQNLYNYLLNPPKLRYNFPYVWPKQGLLRSLTPFFSLPELYYAEDTTGWIYTAPFLLFAVVPTLATHPQTGDRSSGEIDARPLRWLQAALAGSLISGFAVFVVFFWASQRYLLDFIPPALLLSVIGFWRLIGYFRARSLGRGVVILLGLSLMAVSIVISNLLAVGLNSAGFRLADPVLWSQLNNVFRP